MVHVKAALTWPETRVLMAAIVEQVDAMLLLTIWVTKESAVSFQVAHIVVNRICPVQR